MKHYGFAASYSGKAFCSLSGSFSTGLNSVFGRGREVKLSLFAREREISSSRDGIRCKNHSPSFCRLVLPRFVLIILVPEKEGESHSKPYIVTSSKKIGAPSGTR